MDEVAGVTMGGNVMTTGRNDSGEGLLSPSFGVVLNGIENSLIKDNTWHDGVTQQFLVDLGGNSADTLVIKDNLGRVHVP
jgi:hypothetical protein